MRRRARPAGEMPEQLAEFAPADWWVDDLEDALQMGYARIRWAAARRTWHGGGDWQGHLEPPVWWARKPQTRSESQRQHDADSRPAGQGATPHPVVERRPRPIKLR